MAEFDFRTTALVFVTVVLAIAVVGNASTLYRVEDIKDGPFFVLMDGEFVELDCRWFDKKSLDGFGHFACLSLDRVGSLG